MASGERYDEFLTLYARHSRMLYALILAQLPRSTDAEDVFQETTRIMWEKFDQFETGTNFVAWARSILRHEVLAFYRDRSRSRLIFSEDLSETICERVETQSSRMGEFQVALSACLKALPSVDAGMVLSRFGENLNTRRLAEEYGLTYEAMKKRLQRVLHRLRVCVKHRMNQMASPADIM